MQRTKNDSGELNFYLLKCLVSLVAHSHVSRAAEALSISQPAMSRAIGQLRAVTADPILVKGGNGLIPTAKAIQLRDFAERILGEMSELLGSAVAFDPKKGRHTFRLIATDYLECLFVDRLVEHLNRHFPGVVMVVRHPVRPTDFNKALEAGEVDFAVGILPDGLADLRHRPLFHDRIVCVARGGHSAVGKALSATDFAALPHVAITPNSLNSFGASVDQALGLQGLRRDRRFVTPNYLTALNLLARSDMVALLPDSLVSRFRDQLGLDTVPLPVVVPEFEIGIAWHERTHRHAAHAWFRDQVAHSLRLEGRGAGTLDGARPPPMQRS